MSNTRNICQTQTTHIKVDEENSGGGFNLKKKKYPPLHLRNHTMNLVSQFFSLWVCFLNISLTSSMRSTPASYDVYLSYLYTFSITWNTLIDSKLKCIPWDKLTTALTSWNLERRRRKYCRISVACNNNMPIMLYFR